MISSMDGARWYTDSVRSDRQDLPAALGANADGCGPRTTSGQRRSDARLCLPNWFPYPLVIVHLCSPTRSHNIPLLQS